jgi:hypothetical protein
MIFEIMVRFESEEGMSQWSRIAAKRVIDKRRSKQIRDARVVQDREIVSNKLRYVWESLADAFRLKCDEFNSEPGVLGLLVFDGTAPEQVKISRTDSDSTLTISLLPELDAVMIKTRSGHHKTFNFRVIGDTSEVGLYLRKVGQRIDSPTPLEEIATDAIDSLLEWVP